MTPEQSRQTARKQLARQRLRRAVCQIAEEGRGLDAALDAAARIIARTRIEGRMVADDDSDWAADYAITLYERATASIHEPQPGASSTAA